MKAVEGAAYYYLAVSNLCAGNRLNYCINWTQWWRGVKALPSCFLPPSSQPSRALPGGKAGPLVWSPFPHLWVFLPARGGPGSTLLFTWEFIVGGGFLGFGGLMRCSLPALCINHQL